MGNIKGAKRGSYKKSGKTELDETVDRVKSNIIPEEPEIKIDTKIEQVKEEPIQQPKQVNDSESKYNQFLNEYAEVKTEVSDKNKEYDFTKQNNQEQNQPVSTISKSDAQLLSGYMLLSLIDFIFPPLVKWVYGFTNKDAKEVEASSICLTPDQKKEMNDSADIVARALFEYVNPLVIFTIALFVSYSGNMQQQIAKVRENKKKK